MTAFKLNYSLTTKQQQCTIYYNQMPGGIYRLKIYSIICSYRSQEAGSAQALKIISLWLISFIIELAAPQGGY